MFQIKTYLERHHYGRTGKHKRLAYGFGSDLAHAGLLL